MTTLPLRRTHVILRQERLVLVSKMRLLSHYLRRSEWEDSIRRSLHPLHVRCRFDASKFCQKTGRRERIPGSEAEVRMASAEEPLESHSPWSKRVYCYQKGEQHRLLLTPFVMAGKFHICSRACEMVALNEPKSCLLRPPCRFRLLPAIRPHWLRRVSFCACQERLG